MDTKDLYTFIDGLCLPVHFLEFGSKFVPFPGLLNDISKLTDIVDVNETKQKPAEITFKDFLKLKVDLNGKEVEAALKKLKSFFAEENLRNLRQVLENSRDEEELETGLAVHMFKKLKGSAITKTVKAEQNCPCGCSERISPSQCMWIGTNKTWYGEVDILVGNPATDSSVAIMVKDYVTDSKNLREEDMTGDPGDQTNMDMETNTEAELVAEAASHAVVFGFTEYNRHIEKCCFIPTVLIDRSFYYIFLYSPVSDVLVSTAVKYNFGPGFGEKSEFMRAILILWITVNYRIFFAGCPQLKEVRECGFSKKVDNLTKYKELRQFSCQIDTYQENMGIAQFNLGQSMLIYSNTVDTIEHFDETHNQIIQRPKSDHENET